MRKQVNRCGVTPVQGCSTSCVIGASRVAMLAEEGREKQDQEPPHHQLTKSPSSSRERQS